MLSSFTLLGFSQYSLQKHWEMLLFCSSYHHQHNDFKELFILIFRIFICVCTLIGQALWFMLAVSALIRLSPEDCCKFQANISYTLTTVKTLS